MHVLNCAVFDIAAQYYVYQVSVLAGNCTEMGGHTGRPLDARFSLPAGLEISPDYSSLYIADRLVCIFKIFIVLM